MAAGRIESVGHIGLCMARIDFWIDIRASNPALEILDGEGD